MSALACSRQPGIMHYSFVPSGMREILGASSLEYNMRTFFWLPLAGLLSAFCLGVATASAFTPDDKPIAGAKLTVIAGNNQTQPLRGSNPPGGAAYFDPMSVKLTAPDGSPIANASVTFHCNEGKGACQFTPGGGERGMLTFRTNDQGVATLASMGDRSLSYYYATGTYSVTVSYGSIASVNIPFTVTSVQYSYMAKVISGGGQTKMRRGTEPYGGEANFEPVTILVTDLKGNPAGGVRVGVGCEGNGMACDISLTDSLFTDGNGHLTIHGMRVYYATGQANLIIEGDDIQKLEIAEYVTDPAPERATWVKGAKLTVTGGANQTGALIGNDPPGGAAGLAPISVKLTAPDGSPIANAPVTFHCNKGRGACQFTPSGAEWGTMDVHTNDQGIATLAAMGGDSLSFYYATGTFSLTVSYGSIASVNIPFTVTK